MHSAVNHPCFQDSSNSYKNCTLQSLHIPTPQSHFVHSEVMANSPEFDMSDVFDVPDGRDRKSPTPAEIAGKWNIYLHKGAAFVEAMRAGDEAAASLLKNAGVLENWKRSSVASPRQGDLTSSWCIECSCLSTRVC